MKKFKFAALALSAMMTCGIALGGCASFPFGDGSDGEGSYGQDDSQNNQGNQGNQGGSQGNQDNTPGGNQGGNQDGNQGGGNESTEPEVGSVLGLSRASGAYSAAFDLKVTRGDASHKIYYTLDGSMPTTKSKQLGASLRITANRSSYPLTNAVSYDPDDYGWYHFTTGEACTVLRLLETDKDGEPVAEKQATYFIRQGGAASYTLPVVSLTMPFDDAVSFYNDIEGEGKKRAELAYFDFANTENNFALNTQIKIGGNWTKGYPYRTMNVNFNKDENDKKNTPVKSDLFRGRKARNGDELTDFTRFRLHSGGNAQVLNWFGDAFTQRVAAEVSTADGKYLNVATTGYRPCEVFLNGEYWGIYGIREHYSDVYFAQNYGVDKDDVIMLDKAHNISMEDEAEDPDVFNGTYQFEVAEDSKKKEGMRYATELFDFLMYNADNFDRSDIYSQFEAMVDVDSLIDMVLVHFYTGNWDFMNNNIKMWRTGKSDGSTEYTDGKWRFCLHDLDFSFEFQWGDSGLLNANGYTLGANYLDFYLGNAYLKYNDIGYLPEQLTCLLSSPMRNEAFRNRFIERARVVQEIFSSNRVHDILDEMAQEIEVPMQRHITRWGREGYDYGSWQFFIWRTHDVLTTRRYLRIEHEEVGFWGYYYPEGDYFERQIEAAINRFLY